MKLRTVALAGVMSLAGLSLIGAGAHAVFTTDTTSAQTISAGNLSLVLNGPVGTSWPGNGTPNMTLPSVGPVGSSFISPAQVITITNNGSLTASEINLQVTDSPGNSDGTALAKEMSMCVYSDSYVLFNGPLAADEMLGNMAIVGTIAPGATDTYQAVFYAGDEPTGCGNVSGYQWATADATSGPYTTYPVGASAPDAGSPVGYSNLAGTLQDDAEGGTDTVSVTITYSA
jgi:hypothetical protein